MSETETKEEPEPASDIMGGDFYLDLTPPEQESFVGPMGPFGLHI